MNKRLFRGSARPFLWLYFDADKGGGGGGSGSQEHQNNGGTATPPAAQGTSTSTGTSTDAGAGGEDGDKSTKEGIDALPEWARKEIADLRAENAKRRTAEKERKDAEKKAEDERLQKDQEWQKLADQRAKEIESLKPEADEAAKLRERLQKQADAEIATFPDEVKALRPGESASVVEVLDFIERVRPLVEKLNGAKGKQEGNPKNPPSADAKKAAADGARESVRSSIKRTF